MSTYFIIRRRRINHYFIKERRGDNIFFTNIANLIVAIVVYNSVNFLSFTYKLGHIYYLHY